MKMRNRTASVEVERFMHNLISFYLKESPNCDGTMLEDIWEWSDEDWEFEHSFIQWLFPTTEESRFNPDAPVLNEELISQWHQDGLLRHNLRISYERWLRFCGISLVNGELILADAKKNVWDGMNHNWWRMTRILKSLSVLGLATEAAELLHLLKGVRHRVGVDDVTWTYWSEAIQDAR